METSYFGWWKKWVITTDEWFQTSLVCLLFVYSLLSITHWLYMYMAYEWLQQIVTGRKLTNKHNWLTIWMTTWLIAWLIDWLIDGWTDRQSDWLTIQNDWMTLELTDWLDRRDDILTYSISSASMWLYSNSSVFDTSVGSINNSTSFNWSIVRFCTYSWVM